MRAIVLIFCASLCSLEFFGQNNSAFFLDEFSVSVNRTNLEDENTENRTGYGFGAYHAFMDTCKINLIFGVEFNRTVQFKEYMYEGHVAHSTDLTYSINSLSIPLSGRVNFGKKIKVFIEAGAFLDLDVGAKREGTMHTYIPDDSSHFEDNETKFNDKVSLSNLNYGPSLGIGLKIPISKVNLIIKTDYKAGLKVLYDYFDDIRNSYFRVMIGIKI